MSEELYSVPRVREELAPGSLAWVRFNTAIESGKLKMVTPSDQFLNIVKESSEAVGDVLFLSEIDMQILALAFQLKSIGHDPLIVTDDYSIQNVANQVGVGFAPLITFGIRYRLDWILYCPACHKKYPPNYKPKSCEVCGSELKRRPLRKRPVKR
ncbi:MAG: Endoribonuclease Nob1 [Candidatus Bathyarchaeota archaeon BA1]|nr:MAG: Endoribonuclease Nob1 [Candidatus Bathyarchaeota archaeon BA1]